MNHARRALIVVDLGFGDAGKGSLVDFLTRACAANTVIRFNGGAQAAHNVITPAGRHHTFAQFGSGTLLPGVRTYLSRFMLVDPYAMFNEAQHLRAVGVPDAFARTMLDRRALIITPFQQAANRLKELARRDNRHGTCGLGIGETMSDFLRYPGAVVYAGDLPDRQTITQKLRLLRDLKRGEIGDLMRGLSGDPAAGADLDVFTARDLIAVAAENYAYLAAQLALVDDAALRELLSADGTVIFEGAQGVLIDESYGFAPYTTWSNTTFANALTLLAGYSGQITRLGVFRTYFTRHGPGPFVTEDETLAARLPERHNGMSPWQREFRVGHFDLVAARYALAAAGGADGLAITHVDRLHNRADTALCDAYRSNEPPETLTPYFNHDGPAITAIKVQRPPRWDHQEELTRYLFHCMPHYPRDAGWADENTYLSRLEEALGIPVLLTSAGPTAADKQIRGRL